jgi:hypothetical protein
MAEALIVFGKIPRPGQVKTRLTPVLTPDEAARLYRAFLQDALEQYDALAADVRLYLSDPTDPGDLEIDVGAKAQMFAQEGDGLGERMNRALQETLADGYDAACLVGTDHPTLPTAYVRQAFRSLSDDPALCIGPSEDGGFYLLGMTRPYPALFEGMTYSHPDVFGDTLARTRRTNGSLTILPQWYDVDTPPALSRLIDDLEEHPDRAVRTRRVIREMDLKRLRRD